MGKLIGIVIGTMKNAINLVVASLATLGDSFGLLSAKIESELKQFPQLTDKPELNINNFSTDDWSDPAKIRSLKQLIPKEAEMENLDGDPVRIDVTQLVAEIDNTVNAIDKLIEICEKGIQ